MQINHFDLTLLLGLAVVESLPLQLHVTVRDVHLYFLVLPLPDGENDANV